jgi:hypothetical protein
MIPPRWQAFFEDIGVEPPPPPPMGYGPGVEAPEWYLPDTFTGRRYQLWRLRSVVWQTLQRKLASVR